MPASKKRGSQAPADVLIVGGGIIGLSVAFEAARRKLGKVVVLEANPVIADETTAANSGAIHGGFDPVPGKVEALLNYKGNRLWVNDWFKHLAFPRRQIDSLVIAYSKDELKELDVLYERGLANGLDKTQMRVIGAKELFNLEPNISRKARGAFHCNISWLIDPVAATQAMADFVVAHGGQVITDAKVTAISFKDNVFAVKTADGLSFGAKRIVNAAGHYADVIAALAGYGDFKQTARRGEYRILDRSQKDIVRHICFMTPTVHGKGVLVAPMLNGNVLIGPTAEDGVPKDRTRVVTKEKFDEIGKIAKRIVPSIDVSRTVMTIAGSRPIDKATNDFVIRAAKKNPLFVNVAGMQSPGISSAPAIAAMACDLLQKAEGGVKFERRKSLKAGK